MVVLRQVVFVGLALLGVVGAVRGDGLKATGEGIYKQLCVECHGVTGQGVDGKADDALYGDRTLESLAGRISRTMPEDEEDLCVGEDAEAVAAYIYDAFYSPQARAKLVPPKRDLTRLTVGQYRNSVADVVGHFLRGTFDETGDERGLKMSFRGRHATEKEKGEDGMPKKEGRRHEFMREGVGVMLDLAVESEATVEFDLKDKFSAEWSGSVLAEETGEYEFVLKTRNGARLWVNESSDRKPALIDEWVSSGNEERQASAKISLIGGRAYPLRVSFFKNPREKHGTVELLWKAPHRPLERVPVRNLVPASFPVAMVVATPFPADDASYGYERGSAVSKAWLEAVTAGAIEAAGLVTERLTDLAGTGSDKPDRGEKVRAFLVAFAEVALRRPLSEAERKSLVDARLEGAGSLEAGAKRVLLSVLTSPRFLYPELPDGNAPDQWEIAGRLALALWDSVPDAELSNAAREGELASEDEVRRQARRMLKNPRAKAKMRGFFHHWLELERAANVSKDSEKFPEFSEEVLADLRTSLDLFLDDAVWGESSDYRELLQADYLMLNGRLAGLYGKGDAVEGKGFQKVSLGGQRSGVITHPYLLTAFAYHNSTSPIHRGVFLTRNIVGRMLKPPPEAIEFSDHKFDPSLTMREKVTEITRAKACMACHATINPLGFSLENFDAIGRWQTVDNQKPVDTKSEFLDDQGGTVELESARDVAAFAAGSEAAQGGFVKQLFHHVVKQGMASYGLDTRDRLRAVFDESGFSIRELLTEIGVTAAMDGVGKPEVVQK